MDVLKFVALDCLLFAVWLPSLLLGALFIALLVKFIIILWAWLFS